MSASKGGAGELFGNILLKNGVINQGMLDEALSAQQTKMPHRKLGEILIRLGYISKAHIAETLAEQLGLELAGDLDNIPPEIINQIDGGVACLYRVVPTHWDDNGILAIAIADPQNSCNIDNLLRLLGLKVVILTVATPEQISCALKKYYSI